MSKWRGAVSAWWTLAQHTGPRARGPRRSDNCAPNGRLLPWRLLSERQAIAASCSPGATTCSSRHAHALRRGLIRPQNHHPTVMSRNNIILRILAVITLVAALLSAVASENGPLAPADRKVRPHEERNAR